MTKFLLGLLLLDVTLIGTAKINKSMNCEDAIKLEKIVSFERGKREGLEISLRIAGRTPYGRAIMRDVIQKEIDKLPLLPEDTK